MKTNLEFTSQRYYYNEDKKTVTCILKGEFKYKNCSVLCGSGLREVLAKIFPKAIVYTDSISVEFKGTAKCHSEDTYDETLGKRLAESRAKCKAYRFVEKASKVISRYYYDLFNEYTSLKVYANSLRFNEIYHVHSLQK